MITARVSMSDEKAEEVLDMLEDGEAVVFEVDPSQAPEAAEREMRRIRNQLDNYGMETS